MSDGIKMVDMSKAFSSIRPVFNDAERLMDVHNVLAEYLGGELIDLGGAEGEVKLMGLAVEGFNNVSKHL